VFRVIPFIALIAIVACNKGPAKDAAADAAKTEAAQDAAAPAAEPVKPLPEKLPAVLARVNGEDVTLAEVEDYVRNLEGRGGPLPADQRDRVYRGVIDQMVGYKLLVQEATKRKVAVPDTEVDARIAQLKQQFPSESVFMQALIDRKMSMTKLKDDARRDLAIGRLIEDEIAPKVAVKPEQLEAFYKTNPDQFKQPERVRASHILISVPENGDAAAKTAAKKKAEQILKDLKGGKDFAALAREHSQDPGSAANGGDLGLFAQGQMVGPFNDAAFTLKPGATSDLVETQFGFHIIRVAEKQPARTVPLEEVRPQLEEFLKNQNREKETESFVKALRAKGKVEILV
jgi:peptidyl-prolyl cis-trans isomerase C